MKNTRNTAFALAGLLAIGLAGAAHASSATLQQLIDGATFETNGFTFFDFTYSPSTGAVQASDINVQTVSGGLQFSFSPPLLANVNNQIIEFDINYYASAGTGRLFNQATLSSAISTIGSGEIGIGGVVADESLSFLADLDNSASMGVLVDFASATFSPTEEIFVTNGFGLSGDDNGNATLSEFTQTFAIVPTPTAAAAGLSLMGVLALRRRGQRPA